MSNTINHKVLLALSVSALAFAANAFYDSQTVTLKPGWNAFYLRVQPDASPDNVFADWPVDSVSVHLPDSFRRTRQDDSAALSNEVVPERTFLTWTRNSKAASSMNAVAGDTVYVCYNKSGKAFSADVVGRPVAPRIAWHASTLNSGMLNYVGFALQPGTSVEPARYIRGCDAGVSTFRMLYGPNATNVMFMTLPDQFKVSDGMVALADATKASEWSGALHVSPRHGLDFGTKQTLATVTVRNDSTADMTVEATWLRGVASDGRAAGAPEQPALKYRDVTSAIGSAVWTDFGSGTNKTLAAGETWSLQFGIDRTQPLFSSVEPGTEIGGVLRFRDVDGGSMMDAKVPVSATVQLSGESAWPAGLWATDIDLNAVTMVMSDSTLADGIASGGRPKLRVYLHVSDNGRLSLLQRTSVVVRPKGTDGSVDVAAYAPDADVPASAYRVVRLSSAFLPVDVPEVEGSGSFLGEAEFSFNVSSDSPSNPFRHAFHPAHDGLDSSRSKSLPDGTDFSNYVSAVKPKLFSIGNTIRFEWNAEMAPCAWDPDDEVKGSCSWTFRDLRREGDVTASGTFTMKRILKNGSLAR